MLLHALQEDANEDLIRDLKANISAASARAVALDQAARQLDQKAVEAAEQARTTMQRLAIAPSVSAADEHILAMQQQAAEQAQMEAHGAAMRRDAHEKELQGMQEQVSLLYTLYSVVRGCMLECRCA